MVPLVFPRLNPDFPHPLYALHSVTLANILMIDFQRNTLLQNPAIDSGMCLISGMLQFLQCQIGGHNQRQLTAAAAVDYMIHLLQSELRIALYAQVIQDQQTVLVQTVDELIFLLE